jgi:hypothetical protein
LDAGVHERVEVVGGHDVDDLARERLARGEAAEVVGVVFGDVGPLHDGVDEVKVGVILPGTDDLLQRAAAELRTGGQERVDVVLGARDVL